MRLQERMDLTLALRALVKAWVELSPVVAKKTDRPLEENIFVGHTIIPWNGDSLFVRIVDRREQSFTLQTEGLRHIGLPNIRIELPIGSSVTDSVNEELQTILNEVDILSYNTLVDVALDKGGLPADMSTFSNYGTPYLTYDGDGYPMELKHKDEGSAYELAPGIMEQRAALGKWLFNESLEELPAIVEHLLEEGTEQLTDILNLHIFEDQCHRITLKRYASEIRLTVTLDHPSNYFEIPLLRHYEYRQKQMREGIKQLRTLHVLSPSEVDLIRQMAEEKELKKNALGIFHHVEDKALIAVNEKHMPFHNCRRFEI